MAEHDLLIHARFPDGKLCSLACSEGLITEISDSIRGSAETEIDASSLQIVPGWIDSHVHFNEPGREQWEGLRTGSLALSAGGGTAFFDMPLNSSPPVVSKADFERKKTIALKKSLLDFALWGGLTPNSLGEMEAMANSGAIGFKAFMCHSGLDEYPAADAKTLREGMTISAQLDLPVAVHAEIPDSSSASGTTMREWLDSRPISYETNAISLALELAAETQCALHVVHVTCPEGIDLITEAKAQGINVTVETCPHYLLLSDEDAVAIGPLAKCAPPLRSAQTIAAMWERIHSGHIDTIGSDHSPSSPDLKTGDDLFAMWGGVAGIQHGFPLLLDQSAAILPLTSSNVAERFRLGAKGKLAVGYEADFALIEAGAPKPIAGPQLTQHPHSPYLGKNLRHRVKATYLRGQAITTESQGQFLAPKPIS